jgi:DNA (cytosine-5)-methyltransferase 1
VQDDKSATLGTHNDQTVFVPRAYGICSKESNAMKSANPNSGFYEAGTSRTLDGNGGNPSCNQGGIAVVEGNGARPSHLGDGYKKSDVMYTLNATEQHGVAYGIDRATYNMGQNAQFDIAIREELEPTIVAKGPGAVAHPVYSTSKNSYHTEAEENLVNTLVATDYKDPPTVTEDPYYIVRRLTPVECARLQGFPDWWCADLGTENPTEEDVSFWREVFETHRKVIGTSSKPKTDAQIIKWLKEPHSDSAEYKLWGNGVALPCVCFVLAGIVYYSQFQGG